MDRRDRQPNRKFSLKEVFIVLSIILGFFAVAYYASRENEEQVIDISYDSLLNYIEKDKVREIIENPPYLIARIEESGTLIKTRSLMITNRLGEDKNLMGKISESKASIIIKAQDSEKSYPWLYLILSSLPMLLLAFTTIYMITQVRGFGPGNVLRSSEKNFTKSAPEKFNRVTFRDVAGLEEAKEDLKEIVEFLQNPYKFAQLGAKTPKGVLLLGRPGTGKTLLARAVAGEAKVPFHYHSGAAFVEMFVGMGAARVRDLFRKAKQTAPCIVFIDEIDAVAKQRNAAAFGGGNDEREQTLNQLLIEMDGFESTYNIIVMAATNRPDVLDKALTRPGRFDRQVVIDAPSLEEREAILKVHVKNKPLDVDVNLKTIAKKTSGFVGADLENILNEAAILAARHNRKTIINHDLEEAVERVIAGPQRKSRLMSDKEKKIVAYHESGHALVAHLLPNTDPLHKISIIPRGYGALGYTLQLPDEDKYLVSKDEFNKEIKILMGGRAAEELIFGEITSGAANDIKRATEIAKNMITKYGMSDAFGPRALGKEEGSLMLGRDLGHVADYSNQTALRIDEEISKTINDAYSQVKELLKTNLTKLELLTKELLSKEILYGNEVIELLKD